MRCTVVFPASITNTMAHLMSHLTAELILGGIATAFGIACLFVKRARIPATAFLLMAGVALTSALGWWQSSRNAVGAARGAILVDTPSGRRIVTLDVLEHFDLLGAIPGHGGTGGHLTWQERRINVFDFGSGKRLARRSLDGTDYGRADLLGDFGGLIAVQTNSFAHRLHLFHADGSDAGGLEALAPRILAANPLLGALRSPPSFDESSECIEVETASFAIKIDPRKLLVVQSRCTTSERPREVTFSADEALAIKEVPQKLPSGARALSAVLGVFVRHGRAATAIEGRFGDPHFAVDTRTGQPIVLGHPRGALLLDGAEATLLSPSGATIWKTSLPAGRLDVLTMVGDRIVLIFDAGTRLVLDPASGVHDPSFGAVE